MDVIVKQLELLRGKVSSSGDLSDMLGFDVKEDLAGRADSAGLVSVGAIGNVLYRGLSKSKSAATLSSDRDKFEDVLELVYSNNENANMILQEFVEASYGKDLRVFVVGGRVLGCMVRASSGSFKSNFSRGGTVEAYELNPELVWLATDVAKLFNLDIAGVDILFEKDGYKVCEANSAPGFKGLEKIVGTSIAEGIIDYILVKIGCSLDVDQVV